MIDLKKTWAPQLISYAKFIKDHNLVCECWVNGKCDTTSVVSFDEMIEQIFDDLDSSQMLKLARSEDAFPANFVEHFACFLEAIEIVNDEVESSRLPNDPQSILNSSLWQSVIDRANDLIGAAAKFGFTAL